MKILTIPPDGEGLKMDKDFDTIQMVLAYILGHAKAGLNQNELGKQCTLKNIINAIEKNIT